MNAQPQNKVLITGASGQLGRELQRTAPNEVELIALDKNGLDLAKVDSIESIINAHQAGTIINAGAYTAVDQAEAEPEIADRINHQAVAALAHSCRQIGSKLIQISTDFVFSGQASTPYSPSNEVDLGPQSIYGKTKLAGEKSALSTHDNVLVVRTAWVYSCHGHNFVKSMLKLMQQKTELKIVYDQIGSPTWANHLAKIIWGLWAKGASGIYHGTDQGIASWYDFAVAIQSEALSLGLLDKAIPISAIRTEEYPTPARRPHFSVLDKAQTETMLGPLPHWREGLRSMLTELKQGIA